MAQVVPFHVKKGARTLKALTDERMRRIAGLELALRQALEEAQCDLENGMPYLGTALRLPDNIEIPTVVLDTSESILRNANA